MNNNIFVATQNVSQTLGVVTQQLMLNKSNRNNFFRLLTDGTIQVRKPIEGRC